MILYRTTDEVRLGEWLRSTRRPRTAYFIVGIEDKGPYRGLGRVGVGGLRLLKLTVERRGVNSPGETDVVHPLVWDRR